MIFLNLKSVYVVKSIFFLPFVLFSLTVIGQQKRTEPTLKFGDPAPAIHVMKWAKIKNPEVERFTPGQSVKFEPGKVYVVEFWGTWCKPCIASMPHLSELARHYGEKVTVLSIDIWEQSYSKDTNYAPKVQAFVDKKGDVMDYNVGIDDPEGTMSKTWFGAMNHIGTPFACVITKDGKLAWGGHPLGGMQEAIDLALEDKLDIKTSTQLMKADADKEKKWSALNPKVRKALSDKDFNTAKVALDEMNLLEPGYESWTRTMRYELLVHTDSTAAHLLAEKHFQQYYKHETQLLEMATQIVSVKDIPNPDYAMAGKMLQRIEELVRSPSMYTLNQIIKLYAEIGNFTMAVTLQEQYLRLAKEAGKGIDEAQKQLKDYKARRDGRNG